MSLDSLANLATTLGSIAAGVGLLIIAIQLRDTRRFTRAGLLNQLESEFRDLYPVYNRLLEGGDWHNDAHGPDTADDHGAVEAYLEFFEKMQFLRELGVLSLPDLDRMFAHRFFLALHNRHIQTNVLYRDEPFFSALSLLYRDWYRYRSERGLPLPEAESPARRSFAPEMSG